MLHLFIVAAVHTEDAEAGIEVLGSQRRLFLDFLAGTADAFLTDFADILVACFVCFAVFCCFFGKLNQNELAVTAILSVELHNGMSGCCWAGEEIEDDRIFF